MEDALAEEAAAITLTLRKASIELDTRTLVVLLLMEACVEGELEPLSVVRALAEAGSIARSVALAEGRLTRHAA